MNTQNSTGSSEMEDSWIALAHVMPVAGSDILEGARGAFVNAVGPAQSAADFELHVRQILVSLGLEVIEIDDVELMRERLTKHSLSDELQEIFDLSVKERDIKLGGFHTYDDADDLA